MRFGDYSSSRLKVIIRQSQCGHNVPPPGRIGLYPKGDKHPISLYNIPT